MTEDQEKFLNVVLVAWASTGGWVDVRSALTQAFRNFFPEPAEKQGTKPHDPFEGLAEEALSAEGESKVIYSTSDLTSVESTVKHAIEEEEARQIIVAPLVFALEDRNAHPLGEDIVLGLRQIEEQIPDVEILFVGPPFGSESQVTRLLHRIREYEPQAAALLEKVVSQGFNGDWPLFGRFMETPHLIIGDFNSIAPGDEARVDLMPAWIKSVIQISGGRVPTEVIEKMLEAGYADGFRRLHTAEKGFTFPSFSPRLRLDYTFLSPELQGRLQDCRVVNDHGELKSASDHLPLLTILRD
jgi:hypothetical protein